jgi:hypothetical protein
MLANFMVYSRPRPGPRYWVQTMLPPVYLQLQLSQDVKHLVWAKEHNFERSEKGSTTASKAWMCKQAIHNLKKEADHAPNLGLGLIDWGSNCKALRVKWILNYLNASKGPWKTVLGAWLARPDMGRASICTSTHSSPLLAALDNRPSLPPFWVEAVKEFRANKLNRIADHESNHRSQPLWTNPPGSTKAIQSHGSDSAHSQPTTS